MDKDEFFSEDLEDILDREQTGMERDAPTERQWVVFRYILGIGMPYRPHERHQISFCHPEPTHGLGGTAGHY